MHSVNSKQMSIEFFEQDVGIDCNAQVISQYRYLWLNLSEMLQQLGNACKYSEHD